VDALLDLGFDRMPRQLLTRGRLRDGAASGQQHREQQQQRVAQDNPAGSDGMAAFIREETDDFRHVVAIVQVAAMTAAGIDNGSRAEDAAEPVDIAGPRMMSSTLCIRPSFGLLRR